MAKSLEKMILERLKEKAGNRCAQNKSAFLTYWPQVKEMLARGWKLSVIFDSLYANDCISVSYESFRKYVVRQREIDERGRRGSKPEGKEVIVRTKSPVINHNESTSIPMDDASNEEKPYIESKPVRFGVRRSRDEPFKF